MTPSSNDPHSPPNPLPFLLGALLGFLSRPIIMGCFESKPTVPAAAPVAAKPPPAPVPEPPAPQPVVSVPRPPVVVTDRDRAELKAKSLRDKLSAFILRSDDLILSDGHAALAAKRRGNLATARVILHRRALLQRKVEQSQNTVKTVMDMIAAMEDARDNRRTFEAIEKGTKMINEVMQGLDQETVGEILQENKEAIDRVKQVSRMLGAEGEMPDDEFERAMKELEDEQAEQAAAKLEQPAAPPVVQPAAAEEATTTLQKAEDIPDVPTAVPNLPEAADAHAQQEDVAETAETRMEAA